MILIYWTYIIFYSISLFSIWLVSRLAPRNKSQNEVVILDDLIVIIPFRNEEQKIQLLLDSIIAQRRRPSTFIFVDDHSTDHSSQLIEACRGKFTFNVLALPSGVYGKKKAIRYAINQFPAEHYLTLDADVQLADNYFDTISRNEAYDMSILPVRMEHNGAWSSLFSLEYHLFNAFNHLLAPFYVLTGSGANLLFRATAFKKSDSILSHQHISSGDDHFLIRDFQHQSLQIHVSNDWNKSVSTQGVYTISSYFTQRMRWLGKTHRFPSWKELGIGVYLAVYWLVGFYLLFGTFVNQQFAFFLVLLLIRLCMDGLILYNYKRDGHLAKTLLVLFLMQFIYPLLFTLVVIGSLVYQPKWKGREAN